MAKIVIVYDTLSGNTELLVNAVVEGIHSVAENDIHLLKVGSKFSISTLNQVDALIVGSPSIYGDMTLPLRAFLTNLQALVQQQKLQFHGTKGAAFGSYEWDGGWHVERIEELLKTLGIIMVTPPIAIADQGGSMRIHPRDVARCHDLGILVARDLLEL